MKTIKLNQELLELLRIIQLEGKSINEWAEIESSGMFQTEHFNGGFDGVENKFTFSYYNNTKDEYWFEISLEEIEEILSGKKTEISIRLADK